MKFIHPKLKNIAISCGIFVVSFLFIFALPSTNDVQANIDNDYPQCDRFSLSSKEVDDLDKEIEFRVEASDPDGTPDKIILYAAAAGQKNREAGDLDCTFSDRDDDDYSYYCGEERVWAEIKTVKNDSELELTTTYRELMKQVVEHYHRGQRYWDKDYVEFLEENPNGISFYNGDDYYDGFDIDDFDPDDYPNDAYNRYYSIYDEFDAEYEDHRYGDFRWDEDYDITKEGIYLVVNVVGQFEEDLCSSNIARNNGRGVYYNGGKWDKECNGGCKVLITYDREKISDKVSEKDDEKSGGATITTIPSGTGGGESDNGGATITTISNGTGGGEERRGVASITTISGTDDKELDHRPIATSFGGNVNSTFTTVVGVLILISSSASIMMIVRKRKELAKVLANRSN